MKHKQEVSASGKLSQKCTLNRSLRDFGETAKKALKILLSQETPRQKVF
jgi:hypothetical protein